MTTPTTTIPEVRLAVVNSGPGASSGSSPSVVFNDAFTTAHHALFARLITRAVGQVRFAARALAETVSEPLFADDAAPIEHSPARNGFNKHFRVAAQNIPAWPAAPADGHADAVRTSIDGISQWLSEHLADLLAETDDRPARERLVRIDQHARGCKQALSLYDVLVNALELSAVVYSGHGADTALPHRLLAERARDWLEPPQDTPPISAHRQCGDDPISADIELLLLYAFAAIDASYTFLVDGSSHLEARVEALYGALARSSSSSARRAADADAKPVPAPRIVGGVIYLRAEPLKSSLIARLGLNQAYVWEMNRALAAAEPLIANTTLYYLEASRAHTRVQDMADADLARAQRADGAVVTLLRRFVAPGRSVFDLYERSLAAARLAMAFYLGGEVEEGEFRRCCQWLCVHPNMPALSGRLWADVYAALVEMVDAGEELGESMSVDGDRGSARSGVSDME